jgi:lipopolysaccharide biosynthesis glycosyltransferase
MNAIILMAIGNKYLKLFKKNQDQFTSYAKKCNAELIIISNAPDPSYKRNVLCQKMLLPKLYKQYKWIAFFDLDILISEKAPSIFESIDDTKAFLAVSDPRGTKKFENVVKLYWNLPRILLESHTSYFLDRGYPSHEYLHLSINGGVWLCNTEKIEDKFSDFYWSNFMETGNTSNEEGMMAYTAQSKNLFGELDYKFNTQFIYEIHADSASPLIHFIKSRYFRFLRKIHTSLILSFFMYPREYRALINSQLDKSYILHFAGGFPFLNIVKK